MPPQRTDSDAAAPAEPGSMWTASITAMALLGVAIESMLLLAPMECVADALIATDLVRVWAWLG